MVVEVVRSLTVEDLAVLENPPPLGSRAPTVARLSHSHHALARELARGVSDAEAGLIAGYSASRISILRQDPAFRQLLEHYDAQREMVQIDVLERMKVLGLNSIEELQARLEENPTAFSPRELMELTELMLVKGRMAPGSRQGAGNNGGNGQGGGMPVVNVQVAFVQADHKPLLELDVERERALGR